MKHLSNKHVKFQRVKTIDGQISEKVSQCNLANMHISYYRLMYTMFKIMEAKIRINKKKVSLIYLLPPMKHNDKCF